MQTPPSPYAGDRLATAQRTPQGQPTITNMVQEALEEFGQHTPRRTRVIARLIFLQIALLVMTAPLAFWPKAQPGAILLLVAGLALYGLTLARNQPRRLNQAQALLIIGSGLVTAAGMIGQFFWQQDHILAVGLASFPFILTIIEAGLLLIPERVLLMAIATTIFTTILLALALIGPETVASPSNSQAYLLAVMSLGLQALAGMLAWQVARFIMEFSTEVAQVRREEFIATQYEAFRRSTEEQALRLREQITQLTQAIVRLSGRDYTVRVSLGESELKPIADVLNVLAGELGMIIQQQQMNATESDTLRRIAEAADSIARGDINYAPAPAAMTVTPTGSLLQGTLLTMQRARSAMQHRLGHVRDLAIDAGQRLNQVDERTAVAQETVGLNRRTNGHLRSPADTISNSNAHLKQLITATLIALGELLPPEVRAQSLSAAAELPPADLKRLAHGITVQLDIITEETELGPADVAPPPPPPPMASVLQDPEVQARLREAWRHIVEMAEDAGTQARETEVLSDQLAAASRSLRELEGQIIQIHQAVALVRAIAQQIYTEANTTNSQPLSGPLPDVLAGQPVPGMINAQSLVSGNLDSMTPTRRPSIPLARPDVGGEDGAPASQP